MTLLVDSRKTDSVAIGVHVGVGSNNENKEQAGLSHMLEHMLFEGTKEKTARELSNAIESVGGECNAHTTQERTYYYVVVPKKYVDRAIAMLFDIMVNAAFDSTSLRKEKNVVINEIRVVDDDPKSYQWIVLFKKLFQKHPAKNPVYGNVSAIVKSSRKNMVSYFKKYYVPNNIIISVSGGAGNAGHMIEKAFASLKQRKIQQVKEVKEKPLQKVVAVKVKRKVEHSYLVIGFRAPPRTHKDSYTFDVIRAILSRGQSSRLFDEIRNKRGIAYTVGADYEGGKTFGIFVAFVSTRKKHVDEARKILLTQVHLPNLSAQEVADAKRYLEGNFMLINEDNKERAEQNALWEFLGKKRDAYVKNIRKVTRADVMRVIKKYVRQKYVEVLIQK